MEPFAVSLFAKSVERAGKLHRATMWSSLVILSLLLVNAFGRNRELNEQIADEISLSAVLGQADQVLGELRLYLASEAAAGRIGDPKVAFERLLTRTAHAQRLSQQVSAALVGIPGLDSRSVRTVNQRIKAVRTAFEPETGMQISFAFATLSAATELRQLTLREMIVLTRFIRLKPDRWVDVLEAFLRLPPNERSRVVVELATKLSADAFDTEAGFTATDPPRLLYERMRERSQRYSVRYVGTEDSSFGEAVTAVVQLRTVIRASLERIEGRYDVSVPELNIQVPVYFLMLAAPTVGLLLLCAVAIALWRAHIMLGKVKTPDLEKLLVDWSYDPVAVGVGTGPSGTLQGLVSFVLWTGPSLVLLAILFGFYRKLLDPSIAPIFTILSVVLTGNAIVLHLQAYLLGRKLSRLPNVQ